MWKRWNFIYVCMVLSNQKWVQISSYNPHVLPIFFFVKINNFLKKFKKITINSYFVINIIH